MKENESNPTIEDLQKDVPFIVYEGTQARNERTVKRLIGLTVLLISIIAGLSVLLYLNNKKWIDYLNQYDFNSYSYDYSQDGQGINSINAGSQGDLNNGAEVEDNGEETDKESK